MKEEIIKGLVEELSEQRGLLLQQMNEISTSDMNYSIKRGDLSMEVTNIDNQINLHLDKL